MNEDVPGTLIFVVPETLSDRSVVYNVICGEHIWHATDQDNASELAEKIAQAINDHTVDSADVVYE